MNGETQETRAQPRRKFLVSAFLIVGILFAFMGFAFYKASQPRYKFLDGHEIVWSGDAVAASGGRTGVPTTEPPVYTEVYSFRGSYEQVLATMKKELAAEGATSRDLSRPDRRSYEWRLRGKSFDDPFADGVVIVDKAWLRKGENPFNSSLSDRMNPGWVVIGVFGEAKPTIYTRLKDWFESLTGRKP